MNSTVPAISYPGGKARMASTIVSYFPSCGNTYVEPFAGRGNVFWAAASTLQFNSWWLNDTRTAPFFEAIQAVGNTVEIPERTRAEYERHKIAVKFGDATAIIAEPYLTHSGGGYSTHGARGFGGGPTQVGYQNTIRRCHRLLLQIRPLITSLDWSETVQDLGEDDFAYFDPPYIGARVGSYEPADLDHEQLVTVLENAPFRWVLSEYAQDLYLSRLGQPFHTAEMRLQGAAGQGRAVECLWKNF
jgi:site-specific DNA-adenine methylase